MIKTDGLLLTLKVCKDVNKSDVYGRSPAHWVALSNASRFTFTFYFFSISNTSLFFFLFKETNSPEHRKQSLKIPAHGGF